MFVQLGNSVQEIAGKFEVPEGIPFVKDAISGIIDFSQDHSELSHVSSTSIPN
jgi:hypothetical protein